MKTRHLIQLNTLTSNAISNKRNSKINMNIPINHNLSSNDRLSKSSEYVISDVHNQFNTTTLNERILVVKTHYFKVTNHYLFSPLT